MNAGRPDREEASVATGALAMTVGGLIVRESVARTGFGEAILVIESQRRSVGRVGCLRTRPLIRLRVLILRRRRGILLDRRVSGN